MKLVLLFAICFATHFCFATQNRLEEIEPYYDSFKIYSDDFSPFQHLKAEYKQCRDLLLSYPRKAAGLINLNKKHLVKLEAQNKQYISTLKQLKHKLKTCHKHEIYVVPDNFDNESQFNRDDFILLEGTKQLSNSIL